MANTHGYTNNKTGSNAPPDDLPIMISVKYE